MKLDKTLYAVVDANGEFKGLFASEAHATFTADYYSANVAEVNEIKEELPPPVAAFRVAREADIMREMFKNGLTTDLFLKSPNGKALRAERRPAILALVQEGRITPRTLQLMDECDLESVP